MGVYQTDAGPIDAIRTHLKAIRTESARRDPKERGVALLPARERLGRRLEPLPERLAALTSRVTATIEERGGTLRLSSDVDPHCSVLLDIACAAYQWGEDSTDREDQAYWYWFAEAIVDQATRECT
jgi:hypothetical protein